MNISQSSSPPGRIASLHLHPIQPGAALSSVDEIEMVAGKGIFGEPRYFGKISRGTGTPNRRQITLMEREQISEHAVALGLQTIPPGAVRSNIETLGIDLIALIGKELQIGNAILLLYESRLPCEKMDAICIGLRELMKNSRQGVIAEVIRGGKVRVGDSIIARS
jgi:MOSC domain-containing protein YiiM